MKTCTVIGCSDRHLARGPSNLEVFASHAAHALHHATERLALGIDNLNDNRRSKA